MGNMELFEKIDFRETAAKTARSAQALLHAKPCPTGRMPVIIANGFGGLLFHEACGHSLEASSMADRGSEFSGKMGTQIASRKVTLIDDGTVPVDGDLFTLMMKAFQRGITYSLRREF